MEKNKFSKEVIFKDQLHQFWTVAQKYHFCVEFSPIVSENEKKQHVYSQWIEKLTRSFYLIACVLYSVTYTMYQIDLNDI